jgi:putative ABC transport system ATP-binding protein
MSDNIIVKISNLERKYKKGEQVILAVDKISCEFRAGDFVAIVGKSGSGKSTLLNLIGGLDKATTGQLIVNGKDIAKLNRKELSLHRKSMVGIIFQSFNLIHHRTAKQNMELAMAFDGVNQKRRKEQSEKLLEDVGLGDRLDHYPSELSGGETQRVSIARALANNPKILLADEPTGNLDSSTSQEIMELLQKLNKENGLSIIMVTHDQETANKVSDHIIQLKDGKIIDEKIK